MSSPVRTERIRGTSTVFSDYAAVLGARAASAFLSLLSVLITTRILAPDEYGLVAYVAVIGMLIFTITSAWTNTAVSRYGREELEKHGSMLAVTWGRIAFTAPLLGLALVVVPTIKVLGGFPDEFTWTLTWLAMGFGVVQIAADHIVISLEAVGRMKTSALQLLSQQIPVIMVLAAILVTGVGGSPVVVASVSVAAAALSTMVFGVLIRRVALWPPRIDGTLRRRMIRFSLPLIAMTVSQYAIRSVDLIVISAFASVAAVGLYAVAYQGYVVLQQLTMASGPVLTPLFVSLRTAGSEHLVERYAERMVPQLTLIGAVLVGLAVPFVPIAVPILFGDAFAEAADPLAILLIAIVLGFAANLVAPVLVLHEVTVQIGAVNIIAATINIAGDIVLVGPADLALIGPAIATTAAMAAILIGYVRTARDRIGIPCPLPTAAVLPAIAGLAPALALGGALGLAVGITATLTVAAGVVLVTQPFQKDDLALISKLDMPGPMKRIALRMVELTAP